MRLHCRTIVVVLVILRNGVGSCLDDGVNVGVVGAGIVTAGVLRVMVVGTRVDVFQVHLDRRRAPAPFRRRSTGTRTNRRRLGFAILRKHNH